MGRPCSARFGSIDLWSFDFFVDMGLGWGGGVVCNLRAYCYSLHTAALTTFTLRTDLILILLKSDDLI